MRNIRGSEIVIDKYDDLITGTEYLCKVSEGKIQDTDTVVLASMDGAQIYEYKDSDCWIQIWILVDISPDLRYKKAYVLPGTVIPRKPQDIDSFLFPGFHHLSLLQKDGLKVWDAINKTVHVDKPFLLGACADRPGMAFLGGLVGHQGAALCPIYCGFASRRKPGERGYYAALLRPHNYDVEGCNHDDVHLPLPGPQSAAYKQNLKYLLESQNIAQFKKRRLTTGISKPSIISGLP
jgi:hypothetical protein